MTEHGIRRAPIDLMDIGTWLQRLYYENGSSIEEEAGIQLEPLRSATGQKRREHRIPRSCWQEVFDYLIDSSRPGTSSGIGGNRSSTLNGAREEEVGVQPENTSN